MAALALAIWTLLGVVLFFQVKNSVALVAATYAQTGELDLNPLPLDRLSALSQQLVHGKRWDVLEKSLAITQLLTAFQTTDQRVLIIFQSPDELRPTGGFMGAYGIATFHNGKLAELTFEDIYDAAGQMETTFEPPPGVAEYTSGGEGWKLTDANWDPNFPTAVETILDMMRDAGKGEFTGVIAINTTVLHDLLAITGPVSLPEYQTELSVDTLTALLSAHREAFFAGSRAKVTMLQQSFTKILYALAQLSPRQQLSVVQLLTDSLKAKSIQIWQRNPELQKQLIAANAAGTLPTQNYIALIEANVGINKINPAITREILVWREQDSLQLRITWHNSAAQAELENTSPKEIGSSTNPDRRPFVGPAPEADHNAYVNFMRLQTSPELSTFSPASELIVVPPGKSVTKEYQFQVSDNVPVVVWKQSGIDTTQLSVVRNGVTHVRPFTMDSSIQPRK